MFKFYEIDLFSRITDIYQKIDRDYRCSFWVCFFIANLVFLYNSVHFYWGNHDWPYIVGSFWGEFSFWNGRFTETFLFHLMGGRFLPILTNAFAIFGLSLGAILLASYWHIPKNKFSLIIFGLFITLCPYVLYWFYFLKNLVPVFWIPAFVAGAFLLSEKKGIFNSLLAVILFYLSLGSYAACINTIAVIFIGSVIVRYVFDSESIFQIYVKLRRTAINVVLALIAYFVSIRLFKTFGLMQNLYNNETTPLSQLLPKAWEMFIASFKQFLYSYPFIDELYLLVLLMLVVIAGIALLFNTLRNQNISSTSIRLCLVITFVLGLLFSTKLTALVASYNVVYIPSVDFFGLLFVYAFSIAILTKSKFTVFKNMLLMMFVFIIPMSVYRDIEAQKVWKLGFDAEKELALRLVDRFEAKENFKNRARYKFVTIGYAPATRSFYMKKEKYDKREPTMLYRSFFKEGEPNTMLQFYMPSVKVSSGVNFGHYALSESMRNCRLSKNLQKDAIAIKDYILNDAKVWPHEKSTFVGEKHLVVVWNQKSLERMKDYYNNCVQQ